MRSSFKDYKQIQRFVTVDPGTIGIGVALFNTDIPNSIGPSFVDSIEDRSKDWEERLEVNLRFYKHFLKLKHETKPLKAIFIERPKYFESYKGQTAATSDALFKLIFAYGRIWQISTQFTSRVYAIPVNDWKGQLTKEHIISRIYQKIGRKFKSHDADAVGMGLWLLGIMK